MRFLIPPHKYIFLHFWLKKKTKNTYTRKQPTFFYDTLKLELKKIFFGNLKILTPGMPKKMVPKSQAKIKPPFPQYPFFNYF